MLSVLAISIGARRCVIRSGALFLSCAIGPAGVNAQCTPAWSSPGGGTDGDLDGFGAVDVDNAGLRAARLYSGGNFTAAGGINASHVAQWDGWAWAPLGVGLGPSWATAYAFSPGPPVGPAQGGLLVGGSFSSAGGIAVNSFARWDGHDWTAVEPSMPAMRDARYFDDDGLGPVAPALYLGGNFQSVGSLAARGLVRWDGLTWSVPGGGIQPWTPGAESSVQAFTIHDDDGEGGRPPALYIGGDFQYAGSHATPNIARWDGSAWESVGGGTNGTPVFALASLDEDGNGPQPASLFAGGAFYISGVPNTSALARWRNQEWSAVGTGVNETVFALAVFDDDGAGPRKPALFVAGLFTQAGGIAASRIARWDGLSWSTLDAGLASHPLITHVLDLAVFDEDGPGPNPGGLYAGGWFHTAGGIASKGIARWGCPLPPRCDANCNKDFHPLTGQHILTVADFGCFQTLYVLQDAFADCNADGSLTVADFGCFQTQFGTGCP